MCSYPKHLRSASWVCFSGMHQDVLEAGSLNSKDTQVTLTWGLCFRGLLSCLSLTTTPHGARSLQDEGTYPARDHSPSTHGPIIPCPKWSKASLQGLCGSLPSQGQATSWLVITPLRLRGDHGQPAVGLWVWIKFERAGWLVHIRSYKPSPAA